VWRQLELEHTIYGGYSDIQRERAPVADVPLPTGAFDFFAAHVRRGDRIYFQVTPAGFSEFFDLPEIISGAGRFYLLPAVQVKDLGDATVVVSWGEDPSRLQLHYVSQVRFGLLPIYVSRLSGR
jgi:hypothetical protein